MRGDFLDKAMEYRDVDLEAERKAKMALAAPQLVEALRAVLSAYEDAREVIVNRRTDNDITLRARAALRAAGIEP